MREDNFIDYPYWATRELVMNGCHRDYTGNGPVQFYQYDDRIEILNPGGIYGKATPENFPRVNDYRNPVIAEGMRVLGYVNRYSWGVSEVRDRLEENGNGQPEFDLNLVTAFLVKENISPRGMEAKQYAIEQGYLVEENSATNGGKSSGMEENESKTSTNEGKTPIAIPSYRDVYEAIKLNRKIKYSQLGDNLADQKNNGSLAFAGMATKMEPYCGRLALGLEIIKYGCKEGDLQEIGADSMRGAIDLCYYFMACGLKAQKQFLPSPTVTFTTVQQLIYDELPRSFATAHGLEIARGIGMGERTFKRWLQTNAFKKISYGFYEKRFR